MITLLHPSRGRAIKAKATRNQWLEKASGDHEIEHIVSIDFDDQDKLNYVFAESTILCFHNESVVDATNRAAKESTGDILVYLSDDFKCPDNWDKLIEQRLVRANKTIDDLWLMKVDDCLQKYEVPVLTIPIMSRALYNKLGYFWNPLYKSMFVDEDLYWVCKNNNWIIDAPELKFPHEHPCNGKAENDETYKRSSANWEQGKEVFRKRKIANFPL
ncbi:MAG TPA: hypothetical protein VFF27_00190 [Bacteroidia bacterium]|jgi:hypothetical protein|nr:hypothetical protein [Bacteroidia bacterium]